MEMGLTQDQSQLQQSDPNGNVNGKKKSKGKYEIGRKLWHMSHGVSVLLTYWFGGNQRTGFWVLTLLGTVYLLVELIRVRNPNGQLNALICKIFGGIMRPHELTGWNGITFYIVGVCASLALFPRDVAVISIMHLAICDPMASFVGRRFGKYTIKYQNGRTLAGTTGSFVSGVLLTWFFYGLVAPNSGRLYESYYIPGYNNWLPVWGVSVLSGVGAAFGESVTIGNLDDNLVLPLITGMWLCFVIYLGSVQVLA
eukprot:TRINITY_DN12935_c1_g1_i1.p2 TRINITY_DN12935_c1_g1~~TRINITY_DN12935_c1_g1_i1.p2  ORF type:complete len:254 (-),score=28.99 TRINITY_DN12935_c1_g1_i1:320-1081(-)